MKKINVLTIESAIPANDNKDMYLFDWKRNISYLVLTAKDHIFKHLEN